MVLNNKNKRQARAFFSKILDMGIDFKLKDNVRKKYLENEGVKKILKDLPPRSCFC